MKKLTCILISLTLLFSLNTTVQAAYSAPEPEFTSSTNAEDLGDGYYGVTSIDKSGISAYSSGNRTGSIYYDIKDSSGNIEARFKLTGNFTYSSTSVTCTSATYSTVINDKSWSFKDISVSKSGATATATFTAVRKVLGITVKSIPKTITLSCDKNGNLY